MEENRKDSPPPCDPGEYITILTGSFRPAADERDATHYLTTAEVTEAIRRLNPGAGIRSEDVYAAMLAAGFRYGCRPAAIGLDFRWMLHEK
jgi:hypothetical protein